MPLDFFKVEFITRVPDCPGHRPHCSNSSWLSLSTIILNRKKKSWAAFWHFWIFPWHKAQTFLANEHSHSTCSIDSVLWQQNSHLGSTCNFHLCRFPRVGSILEQACQRKVRTFGGTFSFQNFFYIGRSNLAIECSIRACSFILKAARYTDFTV